MICETCGQHKLSCLCDEWHPLPVVQPWTEEERRAYVLAAWARAGRVMYDLQATREDINNAHLAYLNACRRVRGDIHGPWDGAPPRARLAP